MFKVFTRVCSNILGDKNRVQWENIQKVCDNVVLQHLNVGSPNKVGLCCMVRQFSFYRVSKIITVVYNQESKGVTHIMIVVDDYITAMSDSVLSNGSSTLELYNDNLGTLQFLLIVS